MDLLLFLLVTFIGLVVVSSIVFRLVKWMFPGMIKDDEGYDAKRRSQANVSRKNPYSF